MLMDCELLYKAHGVMSAKVGSSRIVCGWSHGPLTRVIDRRLLMSFRVKWAVMLLAEVLLGYFPLPFMKKEIPYGTGGVESLDVHNLVMTHLHKHD